MNRTKDCPVRRKNLNNVHTTQEDTTVGDIARSVPRISASMENRKTYHQTSMVEIQGMLKDNLIPILIDPGANLSYVSPSIVELCKLQQNRFEKSWLIQLATGTK